MPAPFALSVALRQMTHDRGQTLLTIGVVATSVTLILFISSLIVGLQIRIVSTVTDSIPHVRVLPRERALEVPWERTATVDTTVRVGDVPKLEQRQRKIEGWKPWMERIEALEISGLNAVLASVEGGVVVSRESKRISARLVGAAPEDYNRIVDLQQNLVAGRFFGLNGGEAAIGLKLATDLGVRLGQRVSLLSAEGNTGTATIAGIFETGSGAVDGLTVVVPLRDGQSLFRLGNAITGFGLKLLDVFSAEQVADDLRRQLPFKIESWMEDNERTLSGLRAQAQSSRMIIGFTVISSGLAIAALMVIAVSSKYRELGILKAMGASNGQVLRIFAWQGTLLSLIGALVGTLVSLGLLFWLSRLKTVSVNTGRATELFPIAITLGNFIIANGLALATGLLASIYPALRAAKVDPIAVIRSQ